MAWKEEDEKGQSTPLRYRFRSANSYCGYTSYNGGKTPLLVCEGERTLLAGDRAGETEEHQEWLSIGKRFKPSADGTRIENVNGNAEARMDPQTKAQIWISSALAAGVPLKQLGENSLDATMFSGVDVTVEVEVVERGKDHQLGEGRTFTPRIVEYHGVLPGSPAEAKLGNGVSGATASTTGGQNGAAVDTEGLLTLAKEMKASGNDDVDFGEKASNQFGLPLDSPALADAWAKA